ncbi:NUDIX domain-containing protein [Streptomyces sp. CAU 1734]|uniref:NUDIX hydrolase n=1 Tax=Streptomyces sp. CAU 1734 TaxID=3140360 RepID=UPI003260437E
MIIWLNGAFGSGKTSTAQELIDLIPNSTLYDPEFTGAGLGALLPPKRLAEVSDYQDLAIWRRLVVDTAAALLAELGGVLVVPMTLLRQEYRDEIFGGLAARRIPVRHVLLRPDETILRSRIAERGETPVAPSGAGAGAGAGTGRYSVRWANERLEPYRAALEWITGDALVIDNGRLDPRGTAHRIAEAIRTGEPAGGAIVQTPEPAAETLAAGVLLFDAEDRVLLVDPTYKPGWEFPGGVVERGEAPVGAALREVAEELGLELDGVPRLLVVDWEPPRPPRYGGLRLIYDGGRLDAEAAGRVLLPPAELRDWRFVGEEEAQRLLSPNRWERLRWALRARERGTVLHLEAGVPR